MAIFHSDSGSFRNLIVTGSTVMSASTGMVLQLKGSGSAIFSISGSGGEIFNISDTGTSTLFNISSGSVNLLNISNAKIISISSSMSVTGSLTVNGNIIPGGPYTANTSSYSLGSPTAAWKDLYVSNGSVVFLSGTTSSSIALGATGDLSLTGSLLGTASYATTASVAPAYIAISTSDTSQTISGSLTINQNLTVLGTQSVQYITSSQLNISTNLITVNTATPAIRFGGLAVYDSGSTGTGLTGSILWDSQNNTWIYSNPSGSSYDGAMILVGPRNTSGIGNEQSIAQGYAAVGDGSHHMTSSAIYSSGSLIRLENNTQITGSLVVSGVITGSLAGTASWATNFVSASNYVLNSQTGSFSTTGSNTFNGNQVISGSGTAAVLQVVTGSTSLLYISSSGNVGIGTTSPAFKLDINGTGNFTNNILTPNITGSTASGGTLTLSSTSNVTKGKILFGTSAYDEVNNRLGIGTTSPVATIDAYSAIGRLSVHSTNNSQNSAFLLYAKGASGTEAGGGLYFEGNETASSRFFSISADNTNYQMNIYNNGNVAIGTNPVNAGYKLDVSGSGISGSVRFQNGLTITGSLIITGSASISDNTTLSKLLISSASATITSITTTGSSDFTVGGFDGNSRLFLVGGGYTNSVTEGGTAYIRLDGAARSGSFEFGFGQRGSLTLYSVTGSTYTSRFYISGSGNIGIGTTTPSSTLDVNGSGRFTNGLTVTGSLTTNGSATIQATNFPSLKLQNTSTIGGYSSIILKNSSFSFLAVGDPIATINITDNTDTTTGVIQFQKSNIAGNTNTFIHPASSGQGNNVIISSATDAGYKLYIGSNGTSGSFNANDTLKISGSIVNITGSLIASGSSHTIIGTLNATSSQAVSSSYALTASYVAGAGAAFPYTGDASISGSLTVTGSATTAAPLHILSGSTSLLYVSSSGNIGITNTSPTSRLQLNFNQNSETQNDNNGFILANATAATVGLQSISPPIVWQGNGWKTTATAASQDVRFRAYVLPIQSSTISRGSWTLESSINGGVYQSVLSIDNDGIVRFFNNIAATLTVGSTATTGQHLNVGSTTGNYKSTNAGALTNAMMSINTGQSLVAGSKAIQFDNINQLMFTAANSSNVLIARAGINISGSNNTAGSEAGDLLFSTQTGGTAMTEKMRIFGNGNVAIGTSTNNGYKLDVQGTGRFTGALTADSTIGAAGTLAASGLTETRGINITLAPNVGNVLATYYYKLSNSGGTTAADRTISVNANATAAGNNHLWMGLAMGYSFSRSNSSASPIIRASIQATNYVDTAGSESADMIFLTKPGSPANTEMTERVRITGTGTTVISGSLTFAPTSSAGAYNGEIVQFGSGTLVAGQLYFLSSSGTWSLADASSTGSSTGMLGIAVGSSPTANGLLVRGFAYSGSYTTSTGSIVYAATGSGLMTTSSPSSSNHVVRVVGYVTTIPNTIYFNPDATWVTLA